VTEERKTAKNAALSPLLILEPLNLMWIDIMEKESGDSSFHREPELKHR
jgi:hypothetical protein